MTIPHPPSTPAPCGLLAPPDPLVEAFEAASVEPTTVGHREHLYVACSYLPGRPLQGALARYVHHLRAITAALGAPEKSHATITWATSSSSTRRCSAHGVSFEPCSCKARGSSSIGPARSTPTKTPRSSTWTRRGDGSSFQCALEPVGRSTREALRVVAERPLYRDRIGQLSPSVRSRAGYRPYADQD